MELHIQMRKSGSMNMNLRITKHIYSCLLNLKIKVNFYLSRKIISLLELYIQICSSLASLFCTINLVRQWNHLFSFCYEANYIQQNNIIKGWHQN